MSNKKFAPLYLVLTLVIEAFFVLFILNFEPGANLPDYKYVVLSEFATDGAWTWMLVLSLTLLPLMALSLSRKSSPVLTELRSRATANWHLALYRYPLGLFLSMGFCMPALVGDPLGQPVSYTVSIALLPVAIVFLVYVAMGKFATPLVNRLYNWTFHWTGKLVISVGVIIYMLITICLMYALMASESVAWPYVLVAVGMAYLPMRVYLLYWGRGSFLGYAIILAGIVFQQVMLWT